MLIRRAQSRRERAADRRHSPLLHPDMQGEPEIVAGIEAALKVLADLGADVREIETAPQGEYAACNRMILASEA